MCTCYSAPLSSLYNIRLQPTTSYIGCNVRHPVWKCRICKLCLANVTHVTKSLPCNLAFKHKLQSEGRDGFISESDIRVPENVQNFCITCSHTNWNCLLFAKIGLTATGWPPNSAYLGRILSEWCKTSVNIAGCKCHQAVKSGSNSGSARAHPCLIQLPWRQTTHSSRSYPPFFPSSQRSLDTHTCWAPQETLDEIAAESSTTETTRICQQDAMSDAGSHGQQIFQNTKVLR